MTRKHLEAWALAGHEVHWLAGGSKGLPKYEKLEVSKKTKEQFEPVIQSEAKDLDKKDVIPDYDPGSMQPVIHIHRYGSPITVYFLAPLLYFFKWYMKFDVVVDQIHGIPFLSPFWAWKSRKIAFIHEVAQEIWDEMFPFPINIIGKLYEKIYFWFYRRIPFWTVSNSTKNDLIKYGIKANHIHVIPNAIDLKPVIEVPKKEKNLTLLFVGRLVKMKGVEDAINIFTDIKKQNPEVVLWIVGSGDEKYVNHLKDIVKRRNLDSSVMFKGYVTEEEKVRCYQRAHYLLHTSVREGFGLTVLEANSQGTPVIAYDVPGLRDIVTDGENGIILNESITKKISNSYIEYPKYSKILIQHVENHTWKNAFYKSITLINEKNNIK